MTTSGPPVLLRRFGRTGLTVPELGFAPSRRGWEGGSADPGESLTTAWQVGIRFFQLPPDVDWPKSLEDDGEALYATEIPPWDLVVATDPRMPPDPGSLAAPERDGSTSALRGVRIRHVEEAKALIGTGVFDVAEVEFSLDRQQLLHDCLPLLRSWGGAVLVRLPEPEPEQPRLPRSVSERLADRSIAQLTVQAALLSDVVSVVVQPCAGRSQTRSLVSCSTEIPPLSPTDIIELDRALQRAGVPSRLASLTGTTSRPAQADPVGVRTPLAETWSLGPLRLDNRIMRSGTTERAVDAEGMPTDAMRRCHEALAAGGAAMVVTGFLAVDQGARASVSHGVLSPGPAVAAWRRILDSCRRISPQTAFCAQLGHGGALAREPSDERQLVQQYCEAAQAAVDAGFVAVQLHGAHGYLLGQLLARRPPLHVAGEPHAGLDLVRRVTAAVRETLGPDLALLIKLNSSDFLANGYDQRDATIAVRALADTGLDGVEWSGWIPSAPAARTPSRRGEVEWRSEGFFVPFAARTKAEHPHLAVGTCGGFRSRAGMTRAVVEHGLDFVALSRSLIVEPDLPRKVLGGVSRGLCDGCNECLAKHVRPVHCPRASALSVRGEGSS